MKVMFSFNLSIIDVILSIVVVVLLLLFITEGNERPPRIRLKLPMKGPSKILKNFKGLVENTREKFSRSSTGFQTCIHHFGYLKDLPEKTPIPPECFGCPKTLRCLASDKSDG